MSVGASYRIDEVPCFKSPDGSLNAVGKHFNRRNNMAVVFIWLIWIVVIAGAFVGIFYGSRWLTKRRLENKRRDAMASAPPASRPASAVAAARPQSAAAGARDRFRTATGGGAA